MDRIEEELRNQQRQIFIKRISESKFTLGFMLAIVIVLSWNIYKSTDRVNESEIMYGVLIGLHQVQGNLGSTTTMLSIKLNKGETALVTAPDNIVINKGSEVAVIKGTTKQGSVYYYFSGYRQSK